MALTIGTVNCTTGIKNTGVMGCPVEMGEVAFLILVKKGWSILENSTFDQAYFDEQVQNKNFIILPNPVNWESESEDAVYESFDNGLKMFVRAGKIEYVATFNKGNCFHKALFGLSGRPWDLLLVDVDDKVWGAETATGFKGFDLNLVQAESKTLATGTEGAKSPFRLQFSAKGTNEWNKTINFLVPDSFSFENANGVIDVTLLPGTPSAGSVVVKAVIGCDGTTVLSQFTTAADWLLLDNTGTPVSSPTVTYANGEYTIGTGLSGAHTIQLYDSTAQTNVIVNGGLYFQSDINSQTP